MAGDRTFFELSTTNPHAASSVLMSLVGDHGLQTVGPAEWVALDLQAVQSWGFTSARFWSGSQVRLELPGARRDYLVLRVITGECGVERDGQRTRLMPGDLAAVSPDEELVLRLETRSAIRLVGIRQELLHHSCARLVGFPPIGLIRFGPTEPALARQRETWSLRLEQLLVSLEGGPRLAPRGYWRAIEDLFVEQLLRFPWHEYYGLLRRNVRPFMLIVNPTAAEAAEFVGVMIRADPLPRRSAAQCARLAGMSSSHELSRTFSWLWRKTINEFRRGVLLDCVHTRLLNAEPDEVTVAQVFHQWELRSHARSHRFYFRRFGEWPAETLRRSPG